MAEEYQAAAHSLGYDRLSPASGQNAETRFIWAHGWGQNRQAFTALAQTLSSLGEHILIDFPGFGASPAPARNKAPNAWGTADYADAMAAFLDTLPPVSRTIWIGHSFGGRVGLQICARRSTLIQGLVLIASAGLPRQRSWGENMRVKTKIYTYKSLKHLAPVLGLDTEKLRNKFGSSDYKAAGALRDILVKTVTEDLSSAAQKTTCPALLLYGEKDGETPPEIGERLNSLLPNSQIEVLPGLDHYTILGDGRHQVLKKLRAFLNTLS